MALGGRPGRHQQKAKKQPWPELMRPAARLSVRSTGGRCLSRERKKGRVFGGGLCELAGRGRQQTCHIGCEMLDDARPYHVQVPAARRRRAAEPCTWRYRYGHPPVREGYLQHAVSFRGGSRTARVRLQGGGRAAALEHWSRKQKGSREDGEAITCRKGMQDRVRGGRPGHGKQTQMSSDSGAGGTGPGTW
ncbi:hypothetical protein ACQKWADRAFT_289593 [Trichoderma austrokoningii]